MLWASLVFSKCITHTVYSPQGCLTVFEMPGVSIKFGASDSNEEIILAKLPLADSATVFGVLGKHLVAGQQGAVAVARKCVKFPVDFELHSENEPVRRVSCSPESTFVSYAPEATDYPFSSVRNLYGLPEEDGHIHDFLVDFLVLDYETREGDLIPESFSFVQLEPVNWDWEIPANIQRDQAFFQVEDPISFPVKVAVEQALNANKFDIEAFSTPGSQIDSSKKPRDVQMKDDFVADSIDPEPTRAPTLVKKRGYFEDTKPPTFETSGSNQLPFQAGAPNEFGVDPDSGFDEETKALTSDMSDGGGGYCDLLDPFGNPFCPFPIPFLIIMNIIIKCIIPGIVSPLIQSLANEILHGQKSPMQLAEAILLEVQNSQKEKLFEDIIKDASEGFSDSWGKYDVLSEQMDAKRPIDRFVSHLDPQRKSVHSMFLELFESSASDQMDSVFEMKKGKGTKSKGLAKTTESALLKSLPGPLSKVLTQKLLVDLSSDIAPKVYATLRDVMEHSLETAVSGQTSKDIARDVSLHLKKSVPDSLLMLFPKKAIDSLTDLVGTNLTRSVSHSLSKTLSVVLDPNFSSSRLLACYRCKQNGELCDICNTAGFEHVQQNLFHGEHLSAFYSDYYIEEIVSERKRNDVETMSKKLKAKSK